MRLRSGRQSKKWLQLSRDDENFSKGTESWRGKGSHLVAPGHGLDVGRQANEVSRTLGFLAWMTGRVVDPPWRWRTHEQEQAGGQQ